MIPYFYSLFNVKTERGKSMYKYRLYGQNILSSMEFPQLVPAKEEEQHDILIMEGEIPNEILKEAEVKYYSISEQVSWFQNDTGVFYITEGREIHYVLKDGANLQYAQTYLLGYAISMLLLQQNIMTIHCSAIANEDGAILIAGQSGAGKSTITSIYLEQGYKLLADDIVAIGINDEKKVIAYPAFPYQKLCRDVISREGMTMDALIYIDEEKDKFLVPRKEQFIETPIEVKAMVILGVNEGTKLVADQVIGMNKLMAIRENLFLKRLRGEWQVKPKLIQTCLEIGSKVPIYAIARPKKDDTRILLKKSLDQILETN